MTHTEALSAAKSGIDVVTNEGDTGAIAQIKRINGVIMVCLEDDQYSWFPLADIELAY